jgi:hypothetical protein
MGAAVSLGNEDRSSLALKKPSIEETLPCAARSQQHLVSLGSSQLLSKGFAEAEQFPVKFESRGAFFIA